MIGLLRGTYWRSAGTELVLDVGGVGYRLVVTEQTIEAARQADGPVELSVHTALRQDALVLFGFATEGEREVFEVLVTTPGVGPATAMATLSTLGAAGVAAAVSIEDASAFESVSGIGKKTAARIVLELKGKDLAQHLEAPKGVVATPAQDDIAAALGELGYGPAEIKAALAALPDDVEVGTGLRMALREIGRAAS
jgi:Holliday junction DNA helicase RuvA